MDVLYVLQIMKRLIVNSSDRGTVLTFEWEADEWGSIHTHRILVNNAKMNETFELGPSARRGLKRVNEFFNDPSISESGHGFRNPQIIVYDLTRDEKGAIFVKIEDSSRSEPLLLTLGSDVVTRQEDTDAEQDTPRNR